MRVVIAGAGEVGFHVANSLRSEGHDIVVIEKTPEKCEKVETLDILVLIGNASSPEILEEAGIKNAEMFLALTGKDEINMLSCIIAKTYGVKTIARIHSSEYINEPISEKFKNIGIDIAICPELITALKTSRILTLPSILDADIFAKGNVQVLESLIEENSSVINKTIKDANFPKECNITAIFRNEEVIIPRGSDVLLANDRIITIVGNKNIIPNIENLCGNKKIIKSEKIERVMIVGGTRVGIHLAKILQDKSTVILLEENQKMTEYASQQLANTLVIQGSGADRNVLIEEGISDVDAFISVSDKEEFNILCCLLAKQYGAKKVIALTKTPELKSLLEYMGVDLTISPILATISSVLQYAKISPINLLSLSVLHKGEAQVLELKITEKSKIAEKMVKNVKLPENTLIGAIVRGENVIIPRGDDELRIEDRVIVFARTDAIPKLEKLF